MDKKDKTPPAVKLKPEKKDVSSTGSFSKARRTFEAPLSKTLPEKLEDKICWYARNRNWKALNKLLEEAKEDEAVYFSLAGVSYDEGLTPLMAACRDDQVNSAESLLNSGAFIDDIDSNGRTALFHAATYASQEMVKVLLDHGADPFMVAGDYERTCLHQACSRSSGAIDVVKLLLETMGNEAKLEQDKAGLIPIHLAINKGNINVVHELLHDEVDAQLKAVTKDYRDCALHLAARRGDYNIMKVLVENGAEVDQTNLEGQTPLHIACSEGDEQTVKYLHESKASGSIKDRRNRTAIHVATETGNKQIIEMLIDKFHSDINQRSKDGSTLVHLAAKCGHADVALYFVKRGVPIQMPNKEGAVALHEAAKQGHVHVVRALISKGALTNTLTKDKYTPLHTAVRYGKHLVVQILLGIGASVNEQGGSKNETALHLAAKLQRFSEQVVEMLIKSGARINEENMEGDTALHVAIKHRNYPVVKMLIQNGAFVEVKNEAGETPLHLAIKYMTVAIALEIIDDMKKDMEVDAFVKAVNDVNKEGETALHYCANIRPKIENKRTYTDLCKLLLDNHAELNLMTNTTEETPLHYCCRGGNSDVLRMILGGMTAKEASKASNQQNKGCWSPLLIACERGYAGVVRILLENHSRVDIFDEYGKAALHIACENGHLECAELLLEQKAYVNAKTKLGLTAVSLASASGHNQLVELLITKYGAAHDILALNKRSALHLAAERGHLHACQTLLDLGADPMKTDLNEQASIHGAAENDNPQIVKMFLSKYPELAGLINKEGNNCTHIAASKGSVEVMKALIKSDPTMAFAKNKGTGQMPIHLAAAGGHVEVLQLLINQGVPVADEDKDGMTPLHLAAKFGQRGSIDLLKGKIPFSIVSNKTGFTPLHIAAEHDQTACMADFLTRVSGGILSECPVGKPPEETEYLYTSLHLAAKNGHVGAVRMLINSDGVIVDKPTSKKGYIPLHMAIVEGHNEVASLLLSRSADQIRFKCAAGRAPLHFAAAHGHLQLVQLLLGQGAEINDPDNNGWTPLHYAADAGFLEVVRYLVQMGAISTIEDNDGKAPLAFAAKNHHLDVMKFLLLNEFDVEELLQDKKFLAHLMICCKLNNNVSAQDFILNSPAPIYTAIKLTLMYREESLRVKDKSQDYLEIALFCEQMAYDILHIATTYGCEGLLNAIDDAKQPLLDIMIDNEFKDCVAHANVQGYLSDLWRGNDIHIEGVFAILVAFICFIFPPLWFFLCLPFHRWNKIPTLKFICHIVSHMYFIIVLTLVIVVPWDRSYLELYPMPWECALLIWLFAIFVKQIADSEFKLLRLITCVLSSAALGANLMAVFVDDRPRENLMYVRDNIFAFVLLVLIVQIFEFMNMHELFGPWSVIIRSLVMDVVKFLIVLLLFIGAFTLHMCVIYKPVYNKKRVDFPEGFTDLNIKVSIRIVFEELFFACFGLTNRPVELTAKERNDSPSETYVIATFVFAIYQILAIIVLVNLLIAMMSDTYAKIEEKSEIEWKFGRGSVIWNMTKTTSVPAPVNLVTTFIVVLKVCITARFLCCCANVRKIYYDMNNKVHGRFDNDDESDEDEGEEDIESPKRKKRPQHLKKVVPWKDIIEEYWLFKEVDNSSEA
ncbi:serine/threonine-protein phosphatase 6 regulatory ankyrin repeat subunit B-like isoform X3 [Hydractinia symbiolongicarpus]|uniref:serine/threonine-protein phosphatase 6 regulatory ankyrin repeat subunit B-like isoform X3 n=1 Tax=Hydractinia symbiolongicarpus TaxID=13093 RepID=UPI00254D08B0|nr:serine/threonine-protein phosphatase 6 regulatory ankyrin repeat subunit B-like isoform X3 [Hydractinia symbiolongicarpus]